MTDHARLRALAGISEASDLIDEAPAMPEIMDDDDVLDADIAEMDAREAREKRIVAIIEQVLQKIGLSYDEVTYYEQGDREATINTNFRLDLSELVALQNSGLSQSYSINAGKYELNIEFSVDPSFDSNVTMAEADGTKRFWKAV